MKSENINYSFNHIICLYIVRIM